MARRTQLGITLEELVAAREAREAAQLRPTRADWLEAPAPVTTPVRFEREERLEDPTRLMQVGPWTPVDDRGPLRPSQEDYIPLLRQYGAKLADQGERQVGAVRRYLKEAGVDEGAKACGKARTALFALGMTLGRVRGVLEVSRAPKDYEEVLYTPLRRDADAFMAEYESSCLVPEFMRETPEDELARTALEANLFKGPEGPRMRADAKSEERRAREALTKRGIGPVTQGPTITDAEVRRRTKAVRASKEALFEAATREVFAKFANEHLGKFVEIGGKRYGPLDPAGEIPLPMRRQIEARLVAERTKLDRSAERQKREEREVKLAIANQKAREAGPDKVAVITKDGSIKIVDRAVAEEAKQARGVKIEKRLAKNRRVLETEAKEREVREGQRKFTQTVLTQPRLFTPGKE